MISFHIFLMSLKKVYVTYDSEGDFGPEFTAVIKIKSKDTTVASLVSTFAEKYEKKHDIVLASEKFSIRQEDSKKPEAREVLNLSRDHFILFLFLKISSN